MFIGLFPFLSFTALIITPYISCLADQLMQHTCGCYVHLPADFIFIDTIQQTYPTTEYQLNQEYLWMLEGDNTQIDSKLIRANYSNLIQCLPYAHPCPPGTRPLARQTSSSVLPVKAARDSARFPASAPLFPRGSSAQQSF